LSSTTILAAESVIAKRKAAAAKEALRPEDGEKPPLFPENFVTPSTFDPILPGKYL
jgi:hypothetical protein